MQYFEVHSLLRTMTGFSSVWNWLMIDKVSILASRPLNCGCVRCDAVKLIRALWDVFWMHQHSFSPASSKKRFKTYANSTKSLSVRYSYKKTVFESMQSLSGNHRIRRDGSGVKRCFHGQIWSKKALFHLLLEQRRLLLRRTLHQKAGYWKVRPSNNHNCSSPE